MANKTITELTAASTPLSGGEVLPIVQSGTTVKVSAANLTAGRAVECLSLTAGGLIQSTLGGFRFPDGTTQTTAATASGTVTSVGGTGTVNGLTLTGTVTTSGNLTLGGTLTGVSLTSAVTGTLPVANGGTGQTTASAAFNALSPITTAGDLILGNGTNSATRLAIGPNTYVLTSDGTTASWQPAGGGGGGTGTVTSVSGTGTVNGLTLTGTVTTAGSLTLGGTLSGIANSALTNSTITINGTATALGGSISVGTVTSVAALTLGTTGTDLSSTVATGTTTPVITLNVPTASATNRGALSSTDWSTFNGKQDALSSGTNIKTVNGTSLLGAGDVGTISVAYGGTGVTTITGYVKGNGTSAFTASATIPASDISSGAALTKTDDTNVTLTLGGSPTTALLAAASLTLGWTGTLSVARGGTGAATLTGYLKGNGTSAFTASSTIPVADVSGALSTTTAAATYAPLASPTFTGTVTTATADLLSSVRQNTTAVSASAIDCSVGNFFTKTASGALTWTFTNVPASRSLVIILQLTNGGTGTQTWPASMKWPGGTAPTLTTSGVDLLGFTTNDGGTTWRGVALMLDSK